LCGHPLTEQGAPQPRFSSPDAYTPKHLAERILTSKAALEGERKQVTVLFADLKGSMELLADRDPEEARKLLDPVLERMMEAVHHYEGTVNQVMGDGIMALFGAPIGHEDHAVRACYAALRMQASVKRYSEDVRRVAGVPVSIRVGVNSGEVVVRSIGSDLHMDYTAVGHTTHLAARMEQAALPGSIVIARGTQRLAEGYVHVNVLGPIQIKGLAEAVDGYEVTGVAGVRTRFDVIVSRGLSRFVGRDAELEQLRHALAQASEGRGQVVAVVGEAGVGKSRLYWEFLHSHRTQGWLILESGSVSYGKATPYLPVADLMKAYFRVGDTDDSRDVREKVIGKLLALDRALEPMLSAFLALLDVPSDDGRWQALDPAQRRQRTIDAVRRLLIRESQVQPLLVVLEDLHWIDGETQGVLDALVESLPTARLLVLVSYRPEYQHGWGSMTHCTQLRLDALGQESAAELLDALVGDDAALEPLKQLLIARTGGNPFFLEESVRTLVETKGLVGERGGYRLAQPIGAIQVPPSVQAVLAARIDRLPPEEKHLLEAAAVIGKDVPFVLLEAIADVRDDALRSGLTHLQEAEFLYETTLFPDLEYTFKHALTHDVAYSGLLHERRRALHLRILEALERSTADRATEDVERLARHALGAESWDKAAIHLRQAGRRAIAQSAYRAAAEWLEEALRVLERLPESPDVLAQAIDARLDLRIALIPLGRYHDALTLMREAEGLATRLDDRARLGWVLSDICARLRNVLGEHHQAIEVGRRALAIATERGDRALETEAQYRTGQAHFAIGDYRQAIDMFSRTTKNASERQDALFAAWSHGWLAMALSNLGRFVEAMSHATEALRIAEGADHPFTIVEGLTVVGGVSIAQGDLDRAIGALERGLGLVREWKLQPWAALSRLGYAYALSGRLSEARPLLEEVARSATTMSSMGVGRAIQLAWLAEACLLDQQLEPAWERAQEAVSLAKGHGERGHEAWCCRLLGEIASRRDPLDPQAAEDHCRQALTLATELGMRPLVAHCHLGLGRLYRRTGDATKAQAPLATAATMYREMGMSFWLEKETPC
jgi:class 3 adenylate cyclase/tetratricopeptide (TPR) repeat protein